MSHHIDGDDSCDDDYVDSEEEEEEENRRFGGAGKKRGRSNSDSGSRGGKKRNSSGSMFIDDVWPRSMKTTKVKRKRTAIKGMRNINANHKILLVPIREMTGVLTVQSKAIDIFWYTWVRMKRGMYKSDLARVVDVDNVSRTVTVKIIPRIDLQVLANKLPIKMTILLLNHKIFGHILLGYLQEGREIVKKKAFVPPPRFMNIDAARELHIRVEHRRDRMTGDYFENVDGMLFKDGFLYKKVSTKSITAQNGWVEKVDEDTVHIRSEMKGLPIRVFADHVVKSAEVTNGVTKIVSLFLQVDSFSRSDNSKTPPSPRRFQRADMGYNLAGAGAGCRQHWGGRGGRGNDLLVGTYVKVRKGLSRDIGDI
ncbi:unnamed protein product [Arabis nemorensis]|uniref:Spt5 KOW domain-containing protein n=1 Tax=Arabis nemorensis TaxID=586526 RepID=A0A565BL91_9BRAS|nr:unnamed protein product [Arabis nemorensis]